jgi:hypothetical protein
VSAQRLPSSRTPLNDLIVYHDHVVSISTAVLPGTVVIAQGQLRQKVVALHEQMGALPDITDQASFDAVRALVKDAKGLEKAVDACRRIARQPYLTVVETIDALAQEYLAPLKAIQLEGKAQEGAFIVERDRKLAEAEQQRQIAEFEAQNAVDASRVTAPLVIQEAVEEFTAPVSYHPEMKIVDESLIPAEYRIIDMVRLRRDALAGKIIPGVVVEKVGRLNAR